MNAMQWSRGTVRYVLIMIRCSTTYSDSTLPNSTRCGRLALIHTNVQVEPSVDRPIITPWTNNGLKSPKSPSCTQSSVAQPLPVASVGCSVYGQSLTTSHATLPTTTGNPLAYTADNSPTEALTLHALDNTQLFPQQVLPTTQQHCRSEAHPSSVGSVNPGHVTA